jgi:lysozyme
MMKYSETGLAKTKDFEGLRLSAYQDSGGVWTIGYGHTGKDVKKGSTITEQDADDLLKKDVQWAVDCVNRNVQAELNQNQFDALVDFVFNIGCGAFDRSTLLKKIHDGDFEGAAEEFLRWKFVKGVAVPGLLRRREADRKLFLTPAQ